MTDKDFEVDIELDEDDLDSEDDLSGYDDDEDDEEEEDGDDELDAPEGERPEGEEEEGFWKRNINKRLEGIVPDIVKKALVGSMGSLFMSEDGLRQTLSDLRLPKEAITFILNQADNTKREFLRLIAREMRDFLESTNFYEEIQKILTSLSFEIRTEIRLIPNDSAVGVKPNVRNRVRVKRRGKEDEPLYDSDDEPEAHQDEKEHAAPSGGDGEHEKRSAEEGEHEDDEGFFAKMKKERERKGREKKERKERERREREERDEKKE